MRATIVLVFAFVAFALSSSLKREIVPSGTVVNVGKDTVTFLPPNGEAFVKPKENAHQVRDWGHIANGVYTGEFTFVSYEFAVPLAPKDQHNNIVYYYHSATLENGEDLSLYLTYYGDLVYPENSGWTLSINAGLASSEKPILPGTPLKIVFAQAGTYWNVTALSSNVALLSLAANYNTTQYIKSTGTGIEVYLVNECEKYPASGSLLSSNIVVKKGATTLTPVWTPYVNPEQPNQCNFQVSTTPSSISITWNKFNAPPTPTPFPLVYDYSCENGTTVYPDPLSGTIRSNPAGTTYGPNLECSFYLLAPNQDQHVRLVFSTFELGRYGGKDQVRVYDAFAPDFNGAPLPLALVRNGNGNLPTVVTKGRQAFVRFVSDGSLGYAGFVASYSFVNDAAIPAETTYTCGPNVSYFRTHSAKGYLRSNNPAVDTNYFNNVNCGFNITAPAGKKVYFSFSRFALASADSVKIYNGASTSAPILAQYTTTAPATLPKLTTTGSNAYVQFTTDASNAAAGFSVYYDFRN